MVVEQSCSYADYLTTESNWRQLSRVICRDIARHTAACTCVLIRQYLPMQWAPFNTVRVADRTCVDVVQERKWTR
jgi:hypothetical protein